MPNEIRIGNIESSNPTLWVDADTLTNTLTIFEISTKKPISNREWCKVNQFCSVLSIYWLNNKPKSPFGLSDVRDNEKKSMAEVLISYGSMDAQVIYAAQELGGQREEKEKVFRGVETGAYPVGTQIWAGNASHVLGVRLTGPEEFQLYDPDSGNVQTLDREDFGNRMNTLRCDVFVVASGK